MNNFGPKIITAAVKHLTAVDPLLGRFIQQHQQQHGPCPIRQYKVPSLFTPLARSIVYQQLSGKAAGTIYGRFRDLFNRRQPTATALLKLDYQTLRGAGLSNNKVLAVQDLAEKIVRRQLPAAARVHLVGDQELIDQLTQVRGIGVWTVQMFLMSWLARMDVLPVADLGIQKGLQKLDDLSALPSVDELAERGECWKPYRTVASWYLWRRADIIN